MSPALLDALLAAAGLDDPSPQERAEMLALHATFEDGIAALHALPECRDEVPALVFRAQPPLDVWPAD